MASPAKRISPYPCKNMSVIEKWKWRPSQTSEMAYIQMSKFTQENYPLRR